MRSARRSSTWGTTALRCPLSCSVPRRWPGRVTAVRAAVLVQRLAPYADAVIVFAPGAVCMGAGTLYTGSMAALTGDLPRARADLEDAVQRNRALGADPFTMRSLRRLAAVLERCGDPDGAAVAVQEAREIARRRGLALAPFAL